MIWRREFITLLGGAAAWPLTARGQQPAMPVIGFVHLGSPAVSVPRVVAFRKGLRVCPKTSGGITKFSEHEAD